MQTALQQLSPSRTRVPHPRTHAVECRTCLMWFHSDFAAVHPRFWTWEMLLPRLCTFATSVDHSDRLPQTRWPYSLISSGGGSRKTGSFIAVCRPHHLLELLFLSTSLMSAIFSADSHGSFLSWWLHKTCVLVVNAPRAGCLLQSSSRLLFCWNTSSWLIRNKTPWFAMSSLTVEVLASRCSARSHLSQLSVVVALPLSVSNGSLCTSGFVTNDSWFVHTDGFNPSFVPWRPLQMVPALTFA